MQRQSNWLWLFVIYKALVFGLALVGLGVLAHITPQSLSHFVSLLFQWDARHILRVARDGYLASEPSIQVFPAFPLLIRALHLVLRSWEWGAVLGAQGCSFLAFYYLYRLARTELNRENATIALALFALFPTAYFLSVPYTEAAFCAASFAAIYYLRIENYAASSVAGFLAMLTRMNAIFLIPAILAQAWVNRDRLSRRQLMGLSSTAGAVAAGFIVYLIMNAVLYGSPFYFLGLQSRIWGVHVSWPLSGAFHAFGSWATRSPEERVSIIVMEVGFTLAAIAWLPRLARRERILDFVYMGLNLFLLASLDFWLSRPRYVLILYPIFIAAAPWFERSVTRLSLYLFGSAALFGIYWTLYLNAQWAH